MFPNFHRLEKFRGLAAPTKIFSNMWFQMTAVKVLFRGMKKVLQRNFSKILQIGN